MNSLRTLALSALFLSLLPCSTRAQINLSWNDCITQPSAAANMSYACDGSRPAPFSLVYSFVAPSNVPSINGTVARIEISPTTFPWPELPDYWRFRGGDCRAEAINLPSPFETFGTGVTGACRNPWLQASPAPQYTVWHAFYPSNSNSIVVHAQVSSESFATLETGQQYIAGVVSIDPDLPATGPDQCWGCCMPIRLTLLNIELHVGSGGYGLSDQDVRKTVMWQPDGCPTPATSKTWGSIKATYR